MDKKKLLSILLAVAVAAAGILGYTTFDLSGKLTAMTDLQAQTAGTLESTEGTLAETEATLASTQTTLTETEGKLAETEATLASTQTTLSETEGKLAETEATLASTQTTLTETEGKLAETEATLASTQTTLSETEGKLTETEATLASTQTTLTETEGKLTETEATLASTQTALTETEGKLAETEASLASTQTALTETEGKLTETEATLASTQTALTETEGKLTETEATLASTQAALTETETNLINTLSTLSTVETTLTETTAFVEEVQARLAETEGKLTETEATLASTQTALTETSAKLTETEGKLAQAEAHIAELEETVAAYEAAEALAAKEGTVDFTDICGYHIGVPGHYTRHTVSDDSRYYYYYYGDAGDFIMIMPFDMTPMGDWAKDPAALPEVYALTYQSITDAAGSSADSTYSDITINGAPGGYGKCSMSGISTDYVLYYDAALDHMIIVCYADVTHAYNSADMLQVVIDNTCLTSEAPAEVPAEEPVEEPVEVPAEEPAEVPVEEPVEVPAEEPAAASFERLELNGYSIAFPAGYTSFRVDGDTRYYNYNNDKDFIMIMAQDISSLEPLMLTEAVLPYTYKALSDSVIKASGGNASEGTYENITVNNSPAGYAVCKAYGANLSYVLYYAPGANHMIVVAYADVTGTSTGAEVLQVTIDNTCLVGQVPADMTAAEPVPELPVEPDGAAIPSVKAGDIITYGRYEQDDKTSNGPEPVRWVVLTVDGSKALVVTEKALCGRLYHDRLEPVTWETCTLRTWMNTEMFLSMFYDEEQVAILSTKNTDPKAPGVESNDLLFLLSVAEVDEYLNNSTRNIYPTKYATTNGAAESKLSGLTWWWLRSPGDSDMKASYISNSTLGEEPGKIKANEVTYRAEAGWTGAVRPAMWVDLTKLPAEAFE